MRTCRNCKFADISYNEMIDDIHVECKYRPPASVRREPDPYVHPDDVCSAHKKRKKKKPEQ